MRILFICVSFKIILLICVLSRSATNAIREVTHEDIRDAMLSLVHMFRDNTDKLERHESRERQLGEQFKKIFANIEKKQKTEESATVIITETLNNINKRLQEIESFVQQEKSKPKESEWQTKAFENVIDKIENVQTTISNQTVNVDYAQTRVLNRLNNLENGIRRLEIDLNGVRVKLNESTFTTVTTTTDSPSSIELKFRSMQESLDDLRNHHTKISRDDREFVLNELKSVSIDLDAKIGRLADKQDVYNGTAKQFQEMKYDLLLNTEKSILTVGENVQQIRESLRKQEETIQTVLADALTNGEKWYANVQSSYVQLLKEIGALSKVEQVLIQTADNVLDTKKRIEYGTHHILMEVGDLIKQQTKDTNATMMKRFDQTLNTILDNQNNGVANLSSKIELEINQVWRQINIMYQTLTSTSSSLKHLENQTEIYVNGSLNTMHNMENKVGQIRSGMLEVDDNLNYLLGRLSLVTQEFNHIKIGLGDALEQVKANLRTIKTKVENKTVTDDEVPAGPNYFQTSTQLYPIIDGRQLAKTKYEVNRKK